LDDTLELTSSGELAVYTTRPENKIQNIISADELLRIQDLLIQACPFETEDLRSNTCMDCFNYGFVIEMDTQIYSVETNDVAITPDFYLFLDELIAILQKAKTEW